MELNLELAEYSFDEAEQTAFEGMQLTALEIAKRLMTLPQGTLAETGPGEVLFLCPWEGRMEIMVCTGHGDDQDGQISFVSTIEESIDLLNARRDRLRAWLAEPRYLQANPADRMERIVARLMAEYEASMAEWLGSRK